MTRLSPYRLLVGSGLLVILMLVLCVLLALSSPTLAPQIRQADQHLVLIQNQQTSIIQAFYLGDLVDPQAGPQMLAASTDLILEEPDVLTSYAAFNQFMHNQTALTQAAQQQQLFAQTDSGLVAITAQSRHLSDLPVMFWFQLFVGAAGALTGAAVYAFSVHNRATRYYALTGLGYLLFAPSAAIYSTRDLILSGDWFRVLSGINHFGALFFTASLVSLLWHYPHPLRRWPIPAMAYSIALLAWLLDMLQWLPDPAWNPMVVLSLFSIGIISAIAQGWRARKHPVDRASFRWFIMSIFLGTGLFAIFILLPNALNLPLLASQGVMFGAFLLMYWGLALGLIRYRLFELETWWFSIWSWFLSGLSIVVVDILLVGFLSLSTHTALIVAVAVIGWLYFPIRQWILQRVRRDARQDIDQWLPVVLPLLLDLRLSSDQERQIRQRWPRIVQAVFDPLHISREPFTLQNNTTPQNITPQLDRLGEQLYIPELGIDHPPSHTLVLHHAARGQRLFTRLDLQTAQMLTQLAELALSVARARDTGARLERERIARDIHDDLGARLLYLLQKSAPEQQDIVRDTLDDLRHLLNSLDGDDITLDEACANWRVETRQRVDAAQAQLVWQYELPNDRVLTAFEYHHLTRIIREAVTNAFKHSQTQTLSVRLYQPIPDTLAIDIDNDGQATQPYLSSGRGLQNMRRRAQSLHGSVDWQQDHAYHILIRIKPSDFDPLNAVTLTTPPVALSGAPL